MSNIPIDSISCLPKLWQMTTVLENAIMQPLQKLVEYHGSGTSPATEQWITATKSVQEFLQEIALFTKIENQQISIELVVSKMADLVDEIRCQLPNVEYYPFIDDNHFFGKTKFSDQYLPIIAELLKNCAESCSPDKTQIGSEYHENDCLLGIMISNPKITLPPITILYEQDLSDIFTPNINARLTLQLLLLHRLLRSYQVKFWWENSEQMIVLSLLFQLV